MRFARVHWCAERGPALPSPRGVMGQRINWFWTEIYQRRRREKQELLQYVPAVLYAMAGADPKVPMDKRYEFLQPFTDRMSTRITQESAQVSRRRELLRKLAELQTRRSELNLLETMGTDSFSVKAWLEGEI